MAFVQRSMILLYKILEYLPPLSRCSLSCLTAFPPLGPSYGINHTFGVVLSQNNQTCFMQWRRTR